MRQLVVISLGQAKPALLPCLPSQAVRSAPHSHLFDDHNGFFTLPPSPFGQLFVPNIGLIALSNAKSLLGQEFPYAIYDMRATQNEIGTVGNSENEKTEPTAISLNLDALAIVAGTIQQNGTLFLLCPNWEKLPELQDVDALRWNGNHAIATPNFAHYFQQLVAKFKFEVRTDFPISFQYFPQHHSDKKRDNVMESNPAEIVNLTAEQQFILDNLPLANADIHLITAPRGRGKSTLAGRLARTLVKDHNLLFTARSQSALNKISAVFNHNENQQHSPLEIPFIAPDKLREQLKLGQISPHQWLFIDEAATLPLPLLHAFCDYFDKVVLTTTTHNYEGTGKGFSLKFLAQLNRKTAQWHLTKPLRYRENDPLERFIDALLLLDEKPKTVDSTTALTSGKIGTHFPHAFAQKLEQKTLEQKIAFYELLTHAHYKTTPTDLRRLFDAPNQIFYPFIENQRLLGVCWAMPEGGLDDTLTQAIWQGERRPHGNLVAQYLCFQGNLPKACKLRSVRISRLAITPNQQQQGYGKQLVSQFLSEIDPLVDFVSVSFGMSQPLYRFWLACGFQLVQITPTREASSGYHSAMMIFPLSEQGKHFAQQAVQQFERDLPLQPFLADLSDDIDLPILNEISPLAHALTQTDWQNLRGFALAKRTFASNYVSLKRLCFAFPNDFPALTQWFNTPQNPQPKAQKTWVAELRQQVKQHLFNEK